MRLIKIGLANINTTVGAFASNTDRAIEYARRMSEQKCAVGCFQEQVIGGYPAEDLVQWRSFVDDQWKALERFRAATAELAFPTVFTVGLTVEETGHVYNAAAVVCAGRILGVVPKEKLPTYGVFYENRTFSRGLPGRVTALRDGTPFGDLIFRFPFGTMAVEICEDIWSPDGPMRRRCYSGAELVVNLSASPWRSGVTCTRREMVSTRAGDNQATVVYVNQVGGNDSLVFDGGGLVNQNGRLMLDAPRWREGLSVQTVDLDRTTRLRHENTTWRTDAEEFIKLERTVRPVECADGPRANEPGWAYPVPSNHSFFIPEARPAGDARREYFQDLLEAMIMGLDYLVKTGRQGPIGIALSGGKDSVLTLVVAKLFAERRFAGLPDKERRAAVRSFVRCHSMPTRFNTETTKGISRRLCDELGVSLKELPIEEAFDREREAAQAMLDDGETLTPTTLQNIQARVRGSRMWNWANSSGAFWLQTSNMSEKAVGYTTIGGDMMGAYSLIANLPKTVIIELLRFVAEEYGWQGVKDVLATKASAELAAGQEDEKDLMPFPVLDACFALFAGEKMEPAEVHQVLRTMFSDEDLRRMEPRYEPGSLVEWVDKFTKLFVRSIFKWVQTPESVHLGSLDLDRERALQLPVVQSPEWLRLEKLEPEPATAKPRQAPAKRRKGK